MSDQNVGQQVRSVKNLSLLHSQGHIFNPVLTTVSQNICLDEIDDIFEN